MLTSAGWVPAGLASLLGLASSSSTIQPTTTSSTRTSIKPLLPSQPRRSFVHSGAPQLCSSLSRCTTVSAISGPLPSWASSVSLAARFRSSSGGTARGSGQRASMPLEATRIRLCSLRLWRGRVRDTMILRISGGRGATSITLRGWLYTTKPSV